MYLFIGFCRHPVVLLSGRSFDQDLPSVPVLSNLWCGKSLPRRALGDWLRCLRLLDCLYYPGFPRLHPLRKKLG